MRKRIIYFAFTLTSLLFIIISSNGYAEKTEKQGIKWLSIEEAEKLNKKNPKPIFVDVFTDWCGWCKKMDQSTFSDPSIIEYVSKNYYAVKLNAESEKQVILKGEKVTENQLSGGIFKVTGYPTIVLISKNFTDFTPIPGYQTVESFKQLLTSFQEQKK
jgi:thioredoxin-related protein